MLYFCLDPDRLETVLSNVIKEASERTSLYTKDKIQEFWKKGVNQAKLLAFRNMVRNKKKCGVLDSL